MMLMMLLLVMQRNDADNADDAVGKKRQNNSVQIVLDSRCVCVCIQWIKERPKRTVDEQMVFSTKTTTTTKSDIRAHPLAEREKEREAEDKRQRYNGDVKCSRLTVR
jgi:hypothetical protein